MYKVTYDPVSGIVRMTLESFWDVSTVEAFVDASVPELRRARADKGVALVLSDARNFSVQSAEVIAAFDRMEETAGPLRDRMAIVVGSALLKMQGQRSLARTGLAFFTDVEEAERWLLRV